MRWAIAFGLGWGAGLTADRWGVLVSAVLGAVGLAVILTGVAIVDRYRVAAQDVRGIEGRN